MALLLVRLFWPSGSRRRCRSGASAAACGKLDNVLAEWTKAMGAMEHLQDERRRHEQPAPPPPSDERTGRPEQG